MRKTKKSCITIAIYLEQASLLGGVAIAQEGWYRQSPIPTRNRLEAVSFADVHTGIAAGFHGTILRTHDGGSTWANSESGTRASLIDISLLNHSHGFAVGSYPSVLIRTKDSGDTWTSVEIAGQLNAVCFIDANTATAVAQDGSILRTTDGGTAWSIQVSGTSHDLNDVSFTDATTGTAVGTGGLILRTTTGGVTWVEENRPADGELPQDFTLHQNYPNPFNPSTTIEFALPLAASATLRVYDVLGAEVATLIFGNHGAGTFNVTWDASDRPSGVYFYRLDAGEHSETKMAVLLR